MECFNFRRTHINVYYEKKILEERTIFGATCITDTLLVFFDGEMRCFQESEHDAESRLAIVEVECIF